MSDDFETRVALYYQMVRDAYTRKIQLIQNLLEQPTPIHSFNELDERFIKPMLTALQSMYADQITLLSSFENIRSNDVGRVGTLDQRVVKAEKLVNWWDRGLIDEESEISNGSSNG
jgi:hypothetical protein